MSDVLGHVRSIAKSALCSRCGATTTTLARPAHRPTFAPLSEMGTDFPSIAVLPFLIICQRLCKT